MNRRMAMLKKIPHIIIFFLVTLNTLNIHASNDSLSREKAETMINNFLKSDPLIYEILIGQLNVPAAINADTILHGKRYGDIISACYGCSQRMGMLNFENIRNSDIYNVSMTEKGAKFGKTIQKGNNIYYAITICDKVVSEIIGIKKVNESSIIVKFKYVLSNFNEVGSCIIVSAPGEVAATATFGKYDDGWQVEKIDD